MVVRETCPACGSERCKRNGHIHNGKQNHQCKACGRQCVIDAAPHVIAEEQRALVERLLREKSLSMVCAAPWASVSDGSCAFLSRALRRCLTISMCSLWRPHAMCSSAVWRWKPMRCGAS